jgi:hypothetical protein
VRVDEARTGERGEFRSREFCVEAPIEIGECFDRREPRLFDAAGEEAIGAPRELVFDQEFEEFQRREWRGRPA